MPFGGPDTRVLAQTSAYPFDAIGRMSVTSPRGEVGGFGTGFMIDATHVLTAAHMVYDGAESGLYTNITFAAGEQGAPSSVGVANVIAIHTTFSFVVSAGDHNGTDVDESNDYAVMTLDRPIGTTTGWFGLQTVNTLAGGALSSALNGLAVQTAGYPVDKDPTGTHMYQTSGSVVGLSFDLATNLDANHGQSGSPIWINTATGPFAVAVLHGLPGNSSLTQAGPSTLDFPLLGAPITTKTLSDIQRWEAQDAGTFAHTPTGTYVLGIDVNFYLQQNADVAAAGVDPISHYLSFGWQEGRQVNPVFDEAWYLAKYPDVLAARIDPLVHYELFGWKEGRDPSPDFSTAQYLAVNPDVRLAGINPLDHYLLHGIAEHRTV